MRGFPPLFLRPGCDWSILTGLTGLTTLTGLTGWFFAGQKVVNSV